jgi:hypothetical protein
MSLIEKIIKISLRFGSPVFAVEPETTQAVSQSFADTQQRDRSKSCRLKHLLE